jgi:hypothetical protein
LADGPLAKANGSPSSWRIMGVVMAVTLAGFACHGSARARRATQLVYGRGGG